MFVHAGEHAASEAGHIANTNIVHNAPGQMNNRFRKYIIIGLLITTVLTYGYFKLDRFLKIDTCLDHGGRWNYETNECETDSTTEIVTFDKFSDTVKSGNLGQPKTKVVNPTVDTAKLFKIWTLDPNGPHADFWFKRDCFFIVDYDGNGAMPYELKGDSLTVYYDDYIQKGLIVKVTADSLTIKWNGLDEFTDYVEWRN